MMYSDRDYLVHVEKTDGFHRSHFMIYNAGKPSMNLIAEFDTEEQVSFFLSRFGVTCSEPKAHTNDVNGKTEIRTLSKNIRDAEYATGGYGFWKRSDVPENALPIKALSNGSIVTCYYVVTENLVTIYRPNPNAKEVYQPLPIDQHLAHRKIYGLY